MSKKSKNKTMNACVPEGALLQVCDIKSQKNIYVVQTRNNGWSSFVKNCELF